jgi:PAS domain S-box-containing protein
VRWIRDRAFPVRNAKGEIYRVAGIAEDISERWEAQEGLRLFRNLVDQSDDTFEVIDPETAQFLDVNAKGPAEMRCTREEYLQMKVMDIDPDFPAAGWAQLLEHLRRGETWRSEGRHVRKDGTGFPIEVNAKLVRLERPYVVASVRDITERKQAEARVREQAAMLDLAHDAILVRNFADGLVTFWNKGAERLYGWTAEEAVGRNIGDLIFLEPARLQLVDSELLKGEEWRGENRHLTKDAKKLIVSSRATLVRDALGEPKSVLVINTDITDQKELEARFLRAQRMESIGTLASGVAHDLNNILSPIMMSVPLLRRDLKPDMRDDIIETIELSANRGAQIVKQVLTFGRGLEGERHPMQLTPVIKEIVKMLFETFPKDVRVETDLTSDLWSVAGDATQLHQVVLNLCVNARDAMPAGGELRLRTRNVVLDGSYASMLPGSTPGPNVLLEVEDTGSGISPEIIERIFDPFFTTKGVGKGTGLGLSTVLGIVKSHGGHIGVRSEAGSGTTFQIHLPAQMEASAAAAAGLNREELPLGNGEWVLVVDDEEHIRRAVQFALESHGYHVMLATDGLEGLALFAGNLNKVAAVLTDLVMPHMDGVALIHALRRLKAGIPIVASTGIASQRHMTELQKLNIRNVLHKPYGTDALLLSLHDVLSGTH